MSKKIFISVAIAVITVAVAGCYTQLMTIQELSEVRRERSTVRTDASYSLNYNQNCVTCHSVSELNDRYLELKYYNVTTVHGRPLNPDLWVGYADVPVADDIYFPTPGIIVAPIPWWLPPGTTVTGSGTSANPPSTERPRTTGTTREGNRNREPLPATQSTTTPSTTVTAPSTPSSGTTTTTSTSSSSSSATSGRTRTESNDSGSSRTRSEGASRDNGNRPR